MKNLYWPNLQKLKVNVWSKGIDIDIDLFLCNVCTGRTLGEIQSYETK